MRRRTSIDWRRTSKPATHVKAGHALGYWSPSPWNTYPPGICSSIGVGSQGFVQAWFRDPQDPYGVGLSNALSFTVCN